MFGRDFVAMAVGFVQSKVFGFQSWDLKTGLVFLLILFQILLDILIHMNFDFDFWFDFFYLVKINKLIF